MNVVVYAAIVHQRPRPRIRVATVTAEPSRILNLTLFGNEMNDR
jgi:hypothetical protein